MPTSTTQARRRAITTGTPVIPENLRTLAKETYFANKKANEQSKEYTGKRKELLGGMRDASIRSFNVPVVLESGVQTTLTAELKTGKRDVVNVRKLIELAGGVDKLVEHLSIGKEAAEALFGTALIAQCLVSVEGEENVTVSVAK